MEITVHKNVLNKHLKLASGSAANESSMKLCECILLEAAGNLLSLCCNNLETSVKTAFSNCQIIKNGRCAVNAKIFVSLVNGMPEADITVTCDENYRLTLQSGKVKFEIGALDPEGFPQTPDCGASDGFSSIKIKQSDLKKIIKKTVFSAAADGGGKPVFKGELFETESGSLKAVTVDGFRISFGRADAQITLADESEIKEIIPADALKELLRILPDSEEEISVHFINNQAFFKAGDFIFSSRLIEGEFFNYEQNFSADFPITVELKAAALLNSAERSILLSQSDLKKQPFILNISDDVINVEIISDLGQMDDAIVCDKKGSDIKIAFNPKFISEALKAGEFENLRLLMSTPRSACVLCDINDANYKYLVLPVKF